MTSNVASSSGLEEPPVLNLGVGGGGGGKGRVMTMTEMLTKGILNSFVLTLSFTIFLVFLFGSYDYFKNVENNKCEMTYMFEYPEYIRIKLESDMDKKYAKYGLYAYAEGKFTGPAMRHKFTGIPVLFVPGNAGSYKQVRSFASVALRKWLDSRTPFHFDFFSVDFNEELSGLYGYVLNSQSEYLAAAIERIQGFYDEYHSVVLIGHSMGGIVTKTLKEHNEPLTNLIITLSTPHTRPILVFDPEQDLFYFHLSRNWTNSDEKFKKDVTLVSVSGGDRDVLVPEGFTKWGRHLDIHTTTTAVPGVWASTDHLCIVWCKQFVFTIVRALFDLVEYKQPNGFYAMTEDSESRQKILNYHLVKKSSGKSFHTAHRDTELGKPPGTGWNELLVHNYCSPPSRSTTYLMFPLPIIKEKIRGDQNDYKIMILTTNSGPKNWIYGCTSQNIVDSIRYCSAVENLSPLGELLPHFRRRRKVIHLKYSEVSKYSHLVVRMDPMALKSCVNMDVYNVKERSQELNVKFETKNKIFYNLTLPLEAGLFSKLFAWNIAAHTGENSCDGSQNSLAIFQHGNFIVNRFPRNDTLVARFSDWNATTANVQLYLDPACKYTINVRLASLETAGQIFRTYFRLVPSFFGSIILMSLYFQRDAKDWSNFHRVLISNAYHLTILPGFVVSILLTVLPNDWPHMLDGPEYFVILPMFCYLVAYALVLLVATGVWYIIIAFGNAVHAIFLRMLTTRFAKWTNLRVPLPGQIADMALDFTFAKFPIIISVLLISITLATCGGFGLLAGLCFFVIKLFKMYEDILGDLWRAKIHDVAEGLGPLNFQFSCAMMWFLTAAVNFPSLIHWVKSFSYDNSPQWDISMYLSLMVLPTIAVLWQDHVPTFNPLLWRLHRVVFYIMGLSMVIWGTFRLYISGFILVLVLITTAICQLISYIPFVMNYNEEEEERAAAENEMDDGDATGDDIEESEVEGLLESEDFPEMQKSYINAFNRERARSSQRTSVDSEQEIHDVSVNTSDTYLDDSDDVSGSSHHSESDHEDDKQRTDEHEERSRRSRSKSKSSEKEKSTLDTEELTTPSPDEIKKDTNVENESSPNQRSKSSELKDDSEKEEITSKKSL